MNPNGSVSLLVASTSLPAEGRRVTISDLIENPGFQCQEDDILKVRLIWKSTFPNPVREPLCYFVFADEKSHIGAYSYLDVNDKLLKKSGNVWNKLVEDAVLTLTNFSLHPNGPPSGRFMLKEQAIVLKLSDNSCDIYEHSNDDKLLRCLPFNFTKLSDIDECKDDKIIDIFGFVPFWTTLYHKISGVEHDKGGHTVSFKSVRSNTPGQGYVRDVNLNDMSKVQISAKETVYPLLNITVRSDQKGKILVARNSLIAIRITEDNIHLIPQAHQDELRALFPRKRKSYSSSDDSTIPQGVHPKLKMESTKGPGEISTVDLEQEMCEDTQIVPSINKLDREYDSLQNSQEDRYILSVMYEGMNKG